MMPESTRKKIAYRLDNSRSRSLYGEASRYLPGGNSRHTLVSSPYPVYALKGKGCRVVDVDGEERIDFINNYTSLIHGHANPRVVSAVREQLEKGTCFGMPTESEVRLAALLAMRVKYIEKIRFCNSGSEAVMLAIKAARAYTGRHKIAKIEGAYHGIYDYAEVSESVIPSNWGEHRHPSIVVESGSPPSLKQDVIVMPWNDREVCEALIEENSKDLAAVLIDPLPLNIGLISPLPGFLEAIRNMARRNKILFVADEVLNFRQSYQGAFCEYGIEPDLVALGKIIGGGFPVGAVGGKNDVMEVFDHTKEIRVHHGGTFNANPVTMTAGLAAMELMTPEAYSRLNRMGDHLRERISQLLIQRKIRGRVTGKGSLFWIHPTDKELVDYRSLAVHEMDNPIFDKLAHELLANGILACAFRSFGCLSTPMGKEELDAYAVAFERSLSLFESQSSNSSTRL